MILLLVNDSLVSPLLNLSSPLFINCLTMTPLGSPTCGVFLIPQFQR